MMLGQFFASNTDFCAQLNFGMSTLPISERKTSVGSRQSSLKSGENSNKGRHVVIKTDYSEPRVSITANNTAAACEYQVSNKTPLLHEYRNTASQTKPRPTSLNLIKNEGKALRPLMRHRSKSIDTSQKEERREEKKEKKSFETLQRLKEKLLHSSPELNETSDNESTPLVSEVSSPSKSGQSSEVRTSSSKSFPMSPSPQKSVSPEKTSNKYTRSEQNLTETTEISPTAAYSDTKGFVHDSDNGGANSSIVSPEFYGQRRRTLSDDTSTSVSVFLGSLEHSNSNYSIRSCSTSPGHLSRQNALDSEEILTDVYCDPGSRIE